MVLVVKLAYEPGLVPVRVLVLGQAPVAIPLPVIMVPVLLCALVLVLILAMVLVLAPVLEQLLVKGPVLVCGGAGAGTPTFICTHTYRHTQN